MAGLLVVVKQQGVAEQQGVVKRMNAVERTGVEDLLVPHKVEVNQCLLQK